MSGGGSRGGGSSRRTAHSTHSADTAIAADEVCYYRGDDVIWLYVLHFQDTLRAGLH